MPDTSHPKPLHSARRPLGLLRRRGGSERRLLLRLLRDRFGPLPDSIGQRIEAATEEQLERWAHRMLMVDDLGALFMDA